jgi:hypothetical protein
MIKVIINGVSRELGVMTVGQWQKISRFDMSQPEFWPKIVSTALNMSESELTGAPTEALELAVTLIKHNLEWGEAESLTVVPLDELTFGDWIDLDIYFMDGVAKTLHLILKKFANGGVDTAMPAALEAIKLISSWRKSQFRAYTGLFGEQDFEEGEEPEEASEVVNIRRVWYEVLVGLSGQDPLKIDTVTQLPFRAALNFMAWRKDDNAKQRAEMQKLKNKQMK